MRRRGLTRGDGTLPTGVKRPDSISRGDVFEVDEYTDLIEPNTLSKNGGSPHKIRPPLAKGSKEAKPDSTSKLLDENITTEKSSPDKGIPKKPVYNTIDVDDPSILKKTHAGQNSSSEGPDSNLLQEGGERVTSTPALPSLSSDRINETHRTVPNVFLTDRTGGLVRGSDGKMYYLHQGPPGPMGPPGEPVSTYFFFCSHIIRHGANLSINQLSINQLNQTHFTALISKCIKFIILSSQYISHAIMTRTL